MIITCVARRSPGRRQWNCENSAQRFLFHFSRNHVYLSPSCFRRRGVSRPSRDVGGGMRWAQGIAAWPMVARTNGSLRTAKSCGPDTPTLVSRGGVRKRVVAHGGQQARCTRETTYKPFQPLRREGRACSARPVVPAACIFSQAGHGRGQRPAFPAPSWSSRADVMHSPGAMRRGKASLRPLKQKGDRCKLALGNLVPIRRPRRSGRRR